jgi:hypothetical protein
MTRFRFRWVLQNDYPIRQPGIATGFRGACQTLWLEAGFSGLTTGEAATLLAKPAMNSRRLMLRMGLRADLIALRGVVRRFPVLD